MFGKQEVIGLPTQLRAAAPAAAAAARALDRIRATGLYDRGKKVHGKIQPRVSVLRQNDPELRNRDSRS